MNILNRTIVFVLLAILLSISLGPGLTAAQTSGAEIRSQVQRLGTGRDARIEVKLHNGTKIKGYVETVTNDSFTVVDSKTGTSQVVVFTDVVSVKKPRNGLKPRTWAIIAGAAAAAIIVSVTVLYPVLCDGGAGC